MKFARLALALVLFAALALALTACGGGDVAARVNGDVITNAELEAQLEQIKQQYPDMFTGDDGEARLLDFKKRLLDNLINQKLVMQAAEEQGINITDGDVQEQIDQLKQGFQTDEEFQDALGNAGMDEAGLEQQIRDQLLSQKLVESISGDATVTAGDIDEYYKANKAQFEQQAAKRASHILFNKDDKATAEEVLAEIENGGDFKALAEEYSQDPGSAAKGGDLGWPTTPFVPEFQEALDKLDKGERSGLVESEFGWHIIVVTDTRSSKQLTIKEATPQITEILVQQERADAYQQFLDDLRANAEIEIVAEDLKADGSIETPAEGTPVPEGEQAPAEGN